MPAKNAIAGMAKDKPRVLIVPDIPGWAVESMADGIISALSDKFRFTKKFSDELARKDFGLPVMDLEKDYYDYDVIYIMLPSYVPQNFREYNKIVTTFHGGPGTEGQADMLQRYGLKDMKISYVSHQVKKRVDEYPNKHDINDYIRVQEVMDVNWLKKKYGFTEKDDFKVRHHMKRGVKPDKLRERYMLVNIDYKRYGYGLTNLHFTPHGVDIKRFNQETILDRPVFGYAGWARYILGAQADHRRGNWIMDAWRNEKFELSIAGGIQKYDPKRQIGDMLNKFSSPQFVRAKYYEHKKMQDFYRGISCYLVPDKYAGGPMPVLEAGSMGIPVICTDAGLCGDIIEDGIHGIRITSGGEFKKAIKFMKEHRKEREEMGKNLKELIHETRSWKAVAKYWEDFLTL